MRRRWNKGLASPQRGAGSWVIAMSLFACAPQADPDGGDARTARATAVTRARVAELRATENMLRGRLTPVTQPPWIDVSGADPFRLAPLPNGKGYVGLLRGSRALVVLDVELRERGRVALSESPTALCLDGSGGAWVAGRYGSRLARFQVSDSGALSGSFERELPFSGVADLDCGENGLIYLQAADGSLLVTLDRQGRAQGSVRSVGGPLRLRHASQYVLELSLFERSLRALLLGKRGLPEHEVGRVSHDGTLWALDAAEQLGSHAVLVALAGAENKALVRAHGEFENIDSFVWLYRLDGNGFSQLAELNVSDFGVVVPKALELELTPSETRLHVLAAGSGQALTATWTSGFDRAPRVETEPAPPGASDGLWEPGRGWVYASPLFDSWIRERDGSARFVRVEPERRPEPDVRLGEALFFTELMAPDNTSQGTHSRFSCETCHFEGGVDGRTHYTGRADVSVVTKPLFGLANNRPHFSRAMDPDLSAVAHNEFRVAGAGSGTDPWFTLDSSRFPWLHELGVDRGLLGPLELRRALLEFLYAFSHAPNPESQRRSHFVGSEAEGARAFAGHCQACHSPRLVSDDVASEVPFERWEDLIFSRNAPIVWARGDYAKTGVLPYVHDRGTRITSLRRLGLKPRYFTSGSAPTLDAVVERFREGAGGPWHEPPIGASAPLDAATQRALVAFLKLL